VRFMIGHPVHMSSSLKAFGSNQPVQRTCRERLPCKAAWANRRSVALEAFYGEPVLVFIVGLAASVAFGQVKPCRPQRHAKLPSIADLTYSKARKKLLAAGWKPLQTKSSNEAEQDPDIKYGNGPLFWRLGYVEVEACAGTGVAACAFLFSDIHGNRLRVNTSGEELPKEKMYARVSGLRFLCD